MIEAACEANHWNPTSLAAGHLNPGEGQSSLQWQAHGKASPSTGRVVDRDRAVMTIDQRARDGQAEAGSFPALSSAGG